MATAETNKEKKPKKFRFWIFVVHMEGTTVQPPPQGYKPPKLADLPTCNYICWQLERGEENGNLHYQGYVEFKTRRYPDSVRKKLGAAKGSKWLWTEPAIKDWKSAGGYANKDNTRVPGTLPYCEGAPENYGQGNRADLLHMRNSIIKGIEKEGAKYNPARVVLEYSNALPIYGAITRWTADYKNMIIPDRSWITELMVVVGPKGTGKTTWVQQNYPNAYWKSKSNWQCYEGQEVVVIDEFRGSLQFSELLRLCDSTPMLVDALYAKLKFTAKLLILIGNQYPDHTYRDELVDPLQRRVNTLVYFEKQGSPKIIQINRDSEAYIRAQIEHRIVDTQL